MQKRRGSHESIKAVTTASMLVAMSVVIGIFCKTYLNFGMGLFRVTFENLPILMAGILYGPVVGVAGAIVSDPLGYLLHPDGPYFLPFMLVDMSSSFIYGLFFWKRNLSVGRTFCAKFTVNI